jgi:hypothetical protein
LGILHPPSGSKPYFREDHFQKGRPGPGLAYEEADPGMPMPLVTTTTYDVILTFRETAEGLVGSCIYKQHFFNSKSIDRLLGDFRKVLENMAAHPEQPISAIRMPPKRKL